MSLKQCRDMAWAPCPSFQFSANNSSCGKAMHCLQHARRATLAHLCLWQHVLTQHAIKVCLLVGILPNRISSCRWRCKMQPQHAQHDPGTATLPHVVECFSSVCKLVWGCLICCCLRLLGALLVSQDDVQAWQQKLLEQLLEGGV